MNFEAGKPSRLVLVNRLCSYNRNELHSRHLMHVQGLGMSSRFSILECPDIPSLSTSKCKLIAFMLTQS